jgi:polyhydroxyalkanoate synthesis regulator protein
MMKEFEAITRQNMAMFDRAVRMFTPFGALMKTREDEQRAEGGTAAAPVNGAEPAEEHAREEEIADLKAQIDEMRRQLDTLAGRKQD